MKKIFTLAIVAFFYSLGMMAQVALGDIKFSLGEGKKINPVTGKILITFPDVTGVDDVTSTSFVIEGSFSATEVEPIDFDGLEGTFAEGITLELSEFGLQPSTAYALNITSVKVDGTELAADTTYVLNFKTRSAERKMSWTFLMDEATAALIKEEGTPNSDGSDLSKFIDMGSQRFYVPARNYEEILLPDGTPLPMTEDLLFKFGNKSFYVGDFEGSHKDRIAFNGNDQFMTIPDCQEGDVIIFNANRATKASSSKRTCIQAMGGALAPDGIEASTGVNDSIQLGSSFSNFKFEVQTAGDITFRFSNCLLKSVTIEEAQEKLPRNYSIVAAYTDSVTNITLKELVAKTEGTTGSTIKTNYPYWLVDTEGNAYTHGKINTEYLETFDLKNGEGDTIFVVNYAKTDYTGVVYCIEGEDIEGAVECTHANVAVRASMGKAGYVEQDTKLVTLQPGTYKIRVLVFDNTGKTSGRSVVLSKGAGEENEIYFNATADNQTEAESDLLTITEATDITLLAGGGSGNGVDAILIYASTDAPDDAIVDVNADAKKMAVRKVMQNGQVLIVTKAGTVNVAGQLVK